MGAALVSGFGCGARTGLPWEAQAYAAADAGPDTSTEPDGCVNLRFDYEPHPATVMLLVDRSGSMNQRFGTGTRWSVLAEALDVLARCEDDPKPAAEALGCTTSQLLKLLKKEPRAAAWLNQRRRRRGLRELK